MAPGLALKTLRYVLVTRNIFSSLSNCWKRTEIFGKIVIGRETRYGQNEALTYLMDERSIWVTPMTNAYGYFHNTRAEERLDPNRDFPSPRAESAEGA